MEPITDFLGHPVTARDTIVYPARSGIKDRRKGGSQMWMQKLKVTQVIGGESPSITGYNDGGRRVTIRNLENVIVVTSLLKETKAK